MAPKIEIDEVVTEVRVGDRASSLDTKTFEQLVEAVAERLAKKERRQQRRSRDTRIGDREQS